MDMDLRGESKPIVVIIGHEVSRSGLFKPRQTCNDHRYDLSIDRSLTEGFLDLQQNNGLEKSKV
jgi:hypothetical protein